MSDSNPVRRFVPLADATVYLGISRRTLYRLFDEGRLRKYKLGGRVVILQEDLDGLVAAVIEGGAA